jgi:hypothetical protein
VIGTCRSGACSPTRASDGTVCDDDATDCRVGTCRSGLCAQAPATDGTVCDSDSSDCNTGACEGGSCVSTPVVDGTDCDSDATDCQVESCRRGACQGSPVSDCTTCGTDGAGLCGAGECQGGSPSLLGFEDGFSAPLVNAIDLPWAVDTTVARTGTSSLQAPTSLLTVGGGASEVLLPLTVLEDSTMSFWYRTTGTAGAVYLYVYLDGSYFGGWTGENAWTQYTLNLTAGSHDIRFYAYRASSASTVGRIWIDDIALPAVGLCSDDECGRWVESGGSCLLCETVAADCTLCADGTSACMGGRCGGLDAQAFAQSFNGGTRPVEFTRDTYPWVLDATGGRAGSGALVSGTIPVGGLSTSTFTFDLPESGTLSLWYRHSGEVSYDSFYLNVDGSYLLGTTGTIDWTQTTVPLGPGRHTIQLYYYNSNLNTAPTKAWVDDIVVTTAGGCAGDVCGIGVFDGTACQTCPVLPDGDSCDEDATDCENAACSAGVCTAVQADDCSACGDAGDLRCFAGNCGGLKNFARIDFETPESINDFSLAGASRNTTTANAYGGSGSLRVGPVANSGRVGADISVEAPSDGTLTFWRFSRLGASDVFRISFDGVLQASLTGASSWERVSLPLTAGAHVISFYITAGTASGIADRSVYVDNIEFTGYPTCAASNTCIEVGFDGLDCVACDTGVCGP